MTPPPAEGVPPRVSVILPSFLSKATLEGCLEGLRRQTFQDFETIVVDSGPTEACLKVTGRFPGAVAYARSLRRQR